MSTFVQCPLCNVESQSELVHSKIRYGHKGKILCCVNCDFTFLFPRMAEEEQKLYYEATYRGEYEDVNVNVSQRFEADHPEAQRRMKQISSHIDSKVSLLEIGSGSGAFLSIANSYFKRAIGIEPDNPSQKYLKDKNLEIYSDLKEIKGQKFDIIVIFHVLEHILNPIDFLKTLKKYLNANGKIIIEVPNIDDALISFYNIEEFKDFYFCSAHVSYFSNKTLTDCIEKAGLNPYISFIQRYDLHNHLNWLNNKKPGTLLPSKQIFSKETLENYEKDLLEKGISDTLWAIVTQDS